MEFRHAQGLLPLTSQKETLMLVNHTHERLAALGLPGMAKAFDDQQRSPMPQP